MQPKLPPSGRAGLEPPPPALVDAALKRHAAARACIQGRSPALVDAALKRNAAARACIQAHNTALVDAALERRAAARACIHARGKSPADAQRPAATSNRQRRAWRIQTSQAHRAGSGSRGQGSAGKEAQQPAWRGEHPARWGRRGAQGWLKPPIAPRPRPAPFPPPRPGSPPGSLPTQSAAWGPSPASRVASLCAAARSSSGRAGPDGLRPRRGYTQSARVTPPKNSPPHAGCSPLWRPAAALLAPRFHSIVAAACPVCLSRWQVEQI